MFANLIRPRAMTLFGALALTCAMIAGSPTSAGGKTDRDIFDLKAQQAAMRKGRPPKGAPAISSMPGLVEVMANQERMRAELGRITQALKKAKILT